MKLSKYLVLFGFVASTISVSLLATQQKKAVPAKAEVVLTEPDGDLKLEAAKIKGYTENHFETMVGPSGDVVTSYVFSAAGNTTKNPEIRFVTDGTQTVNKPYDLVAEETVEVHFWYKLVNSSPKNVDDGDYPYLLQVLGTDGTYPLHQWNPVVDGEWHLGVLETGDYHDKFAGMLVKMGDINGSLTIANIKSYSTTVVDLKTVFPATFNGTFLYRYIQNFYFDINLSERIFDNKSYIDTGNESKFKGPDDEVIPLAEGIVVNGKTLAEWRTYVSAQKSFPRNDGVTSFPLYAGTQYNPLSIETGTTRISFKINVEEIPMDGMVVTFKAGLFYGFYDNKTFVLDQDLTYYSVPSSSGSPARISFSQVKTWEETHLGINHVDNWGTQTASQGAHYTRYVLWTDIPFDREVIKYGCPADNYRYMYDNILMNGKPLVYYHAWARGNSKDFTELNFDDPTQSIQNPDYELGHPLNNAVHSNYDLAVGVSIVRDQAKYTFFIDVPDQLVTDLSLGALTFALRDGSDWMTSRDGNVVIYRYSKQLHDDYLVVKAFVDEKLHMTDYTENLGYCNDDSHHYYLTAKEALYALTDSQKELFVTHADFALAKARYEAWASFNNDANPYDGNLSLPSPNTSLNKDQKNNSLIIVVAIISVTLACSTSIFIVIKKRRHNA